MHLYWYDNHSLRTPAKSDTINEVGQIEHVRKHTEKMNADMKNQT